MTLKAIIFDVDGTLAETEEAHRTAFNRAFAEAGRPWTWSQEAYRGLLQVTGGEERMRHFLASIGEPAPATLVADLHRRKNAAYAELVAEKMVALRPGVARLIDEARTAGVRLGIATTTSRPNLLALLASAFPPVATTWFDAVVTGEMVTTKKPDPEVYARALEALGLPADACVAVEDSRHGLTAALACGITTVITRSFYLDQDDFAGAAMVCRDLETPPVGLADLDALLGGAAERGGAAMAATDGARR